MVISRNGYVAWRTDYYKLNELLGSRDFPDAHFEHSRVHFASRTTPFTLGGVVILHVSPDCSGICSYRQEGVQLKDQWQADSIWERQYSGLIWPLQCTTVTDIFFTAVVRTEHAVEMRNWRVLSLSYLCVFFRQILNLWNVPLWKLFYK
jgi:hypothetical protein